VDLILELATIRRHLDEFEAIIFDHANLRAVFEEVMELLFGSRSVQLIFVAGPTGVGKTTLITLVLRKLREAYADVMAKNPGLIPVVSMTCPEHPRGYSLVDHYDEILRAMDEPLIGNKLAFDEQVSARRGNSHAIEGPRQSAASGLRHRGTEVLVMDEGHHMCSLSTPRSWYDQAEALKYFAELTGVRHLIVGTEDVLRLRDENPQLKRRSRAIYFRPYGESKADVTAFLEGIKFAMTKCPIPCGFDADEKLGYLMLKSLGAPGLIKDLLAQAAHRSIRQGRRAITSDDLDSCGLIATDSENLVQVVRSGAEAAKQHGAKPPRKSRPGKIKPRLNALADPDEVYA
jgi:hypothetical protein